MEEVGYTAMTAVSESQTIKQTQKCAAGSFDKVLTPTLPPSTERVEMFLFSSPAFFKLFSSGDHFY
jgi:hypothetical protein